MCNVICRVVICSFLLMWPSAALSRDADCDPQVNPALQFQQNLRARLQLGPWTPGTWLETVDRPIVGPGTYAGTSGAGVAFGMSVVSAAQVDRADQIPGVPPGQAQWGLDHEFQISSFVGLLSGPGGSARIVGSSYSMLDGAGLRRCFVVVGGEVTEDVFQMLVDGPITPPPPVGPEVDPGDEILFHASTFVVAGAPPLVPVECVECERAYREKVDLAVRDLIAEVNRAKNERDTAVATAQAVCAAEVQAAFNYGGARMAVGVGAGGALLAPVLLIPGVNVVVVCGTAITAFTGMAINTVDAWADAKVKANLAIAIRNATIVGARSTYAAAVAAAAATFVWDVIQAGVERDQCLKDHGCVGHAPVVHPIE